MSHTNSHDYRHRAEYRLVLAEGSDSRGPGAAVTVALCGHWEHEGDCPWPHLSAMEALGDRTYRLIVQFDAPDDELDTVKARIAGALQGGQVVGPEGQPSQWETLG